MSKTDFLSVIPLFILTSSAILIMFSISVKRNHKLIYAITAASLIGDFVYLVLYNAKVKWVIEPLFIFDGFGIFNMGLILLTAVAVTMISYAYFEQREERKEEFHGARRRFADTGRHSRCRKDVCGRGCDSHSHAPAAGVLQRKSVGVHRGELIRESGIVCRAADFTDS